MLIDCSMQSLPRSGFMKHTDSTNPDPKHQTARSNFQTINARFLRVCVRGKTQAAAPEMQIPKPKNSLRISYSTTPDLLQVYIGGETEVVVNAAISLVENLLVAVRRKIQAFIASMPPAIPTFPAAYGYQQNSNAQAYNIQSMAMQAIQAAHGMSGHNQPQQPHYPPQMMPAPRPPAPAPVPSNGRYNAVAPPSFVQATAEEVMR